MSKPREFSLHAEGLWYGIEEMPPTHTDCFFHVIEKSAYNDAIKMLEEMAGVLETVMCDTQDHHIIKLADDALDNYRKWKEGMK